MKDVTNFNPRRVRRYKYRIYPSADQQQILHQTMGCTRAIYNTVLYMNQQIYKNRNLYPDVKMIRLAEACRILTHKSNDPKTPWFKEVSTDALQQSLRDLDQAITHGFTVKGRRLPVFKKKGAEMSCRYPVRGKNQLQDLSTGYIKLPKLGKVAIKLHRELPGPFKSATVIKEANEWHVSLTVELSNAPRLKAITKSSVIGMDLGLKDLGILSTGYKIPTLDPDHLLKLETKLANRQRVLARKSKQSNSWYRAKTLVQKSYLKIKRFRSHYLHQVSNYLVSLGKHLVVEDLNIPKMLKTGYLAKRISDSGWGSLLNILQYKLRDQGLRLLKTHPLFASSKTCSACQCKNHTLTLQHRSWMCQSCNTEHDRDVNAATNLVNRALNRIKGSVKYKDLQGIVYLDMAYNAR